MAKQDKPILEIKSNFIWIRNTLYLKIPSTMRKDSNFPFINGTIHGKPSADKVTIEMHEKKLVVK